MDERNPQGTADKERGDAGAGGEDKGVRDDAGKETVEKTVEKTTTVEDGDATRERD